ncbi:MULTISPECIES: heparin lyase I family protein [unclassified Rhizobium]|uniref:heparin lyase I family protein n=1 Tax=unclassified Rhizobium TaxID=2613769 RepID=UPI00161B4431|nr:MULTISPECIES: heparin lyase I family protein [unclassified Rhizobium]MBB3318835.1 hypothetical protein [Rhizobium sp. BK181]MCS3742383.1 hypothetical protein [Rhizobium sp. BK661]MCS4094789.1 hypothetical protein [Rhizobium sp. BK176]
MKAICTYLLYNRCLVGLASMFLLCASHATAKDMADDFNAGKLDPTRWSTIQAEPHQIGYPKDARCGGSAISLTVKDGDSGKSCDGPCQRAELRTQNAYRSKYGDDQWYAFSFRVAGDVPPTNSDRFVVSQWKAPNDISPFLAQRFDNGVFYITVQDGERRRTVVSADGDPEALQAAQEVLSKVDPQNQQMVSAINTLQQLQLFRTQQPALDSLFSDTLKDALGSQRPDAPSVKELATKLGIDDSDLVPAIGDLSFATDIHEYLGPANIDVTLESKDPLPDPRKGWVDMVYHVKNGRTDNTVVPPKKGFIEIWANGNKMATVTGDLGAKITEPNDLTGYFKFGIYRAPLPGKFEFRFDEYSQAAKKADLAKMCN